MFVVPLGHLGTRGVLDLDRLTAPWQVSYKRIRGRARIG